MESVVTWTEKFKDGNPILQEGTWAFYAYVLQNGKAKVWKKIHGKQVQIATLSKGSIFGEMSFLGGVKRTTTVTADGDVEVGMIPKDSFMEAVDQLPQSVRAKLDTMVSDLTCITEVYGLLIDRLSDVQNIDTKMIDIKTFEKEIESMPELLRRTVLALAQRRNTAMEGCPKLAAQVEEAVKAVDSISLASTK